MEKYPAIKFAIFFIGGIVFTEFYKIDYNILIIVSTLLILLLFFLNITIRSNTYIFKQILTVVLILLFGVLIAEINKPNENFLNSEIYKLKNFTAYGKISEISLMNSYEVSFELKTDSIRIKDKILAKEINLLCKVRDSQKKLNQLYENINPGNSISLKGTYSKGREMRNPGEFDYNKYLNSAGISGILLSYEAKDFKKIDDNIYFFPNLIYKIRKNISGYLELLHNIETASLLKGLLLADRKEISFETKNEFINAGVIHVLAVSGLHVGYIILIFVVLFGRFNLYSKSIITIVGLLLFMFITGMPSSVVRATIMALVIIISFITNRTTNIFNSLAIAALIILVFHPYDLFSPGFQLSFSAVAAIAVFTPFFQRIIFSYRIKSAYLKNILLFMAVSLSAQIGTLPFTLIYFGKLSLVALAANIVVIPLIGFIVSISIFTLIINLIIPAAAVYYAFANEMLALILFNIVHFFGNEDFSYITIRQFSVTDAVLFYFFISIFFYFLPEFKSLIMKSLLLILIIANIIIFTSLDNKELLKENELNIMMIDVGQGDAILIKFPDGKTALIDAGDSTPFFDNGERIIIPLLGYLGIDKIDYGFVSHLDNDHYGGFISLITKNKIKEIIKPAFDSSSVKDQKFEKFLKQFKIPFSYYEKKIMNFGNCRMYMLNNLNDGFYSSLSSNNKSGLLKIVYGKTSILLTGDIEKKAEKYYSNIYKKFLKSDILKVAHHGSTTSTIPEFINYVRPKISLISAGILNKFNHPSSITIQRLSEIKSGIYRTDHQGALLFHSNGDSIYFNDWKRL